MRFGIRRPPWWVLFPTVTRLIVVLRVFFYLQIQALHCLLLWPGHGWSSGKIWRIWCPPNYLEDMSAMLVAIKKVFVTRLSRNYMYVTLVWIKKVFVAQEKSERPNRSLPHCKVSCEDKEFKNTKFLSWCQKTHRDYDVTTFIKRTQHARATYCNRHLFVLVILSSYCPLTKQGQFWPLLPFPGCTKCYLTAKK